MIKYLYKLLIRPTAIILLSLFCTHYFNLNTIIPFISENDTSINISLYSIVITAIFVGIEDFIKNKFITVELYLNSNSTFLNKKDDNISLEKYKTQQIYARIHCEKIDKLKDGSIVIKMKIPDIISASVNDNVVQENNEIIVTELCEEDSVIPITLAANKNKKSTDIELFIDKKPAYILVKNNKMKVGV